MNIEYIGEFEPRYAKPGDAGVDLVCAEDVRLEPGERALIGTGLSIALPSGTVGLVTPRSGLAAKQGLSIVNSPGVVDSGYRGEIKVSLINLDPRQVIELPAGSRVAQLVILPFVHATFEKVASLTETERGASGHGSTGTAVV